LLEVEAIAEIITEILLGEGVELGIEDRELLEVHGEGVLGGDRVGLDGGRGLHECLGGLVDLVCLVGLGFGGA
jgi:hypothetical protein